jgi:hypothetical protein
MRRHFTLLMAALIVCSRSAQAEPNVAALLQLHADEARSYQIFLDDKQSRPLELRAKPVFSWTNLVGEHTQQGHLFVWTADGRPEAIGTIFSTKAMEPGRRILVHEFHSLSPDRLYPVTPASSQYKWTPAAGVKFFAETETLVADTAPTRLVQMRNRVRRISGESQSREGQKWDLRLLPTPLFQYEPMQGQVIHGAIFALVSSAGTDPELLVLIEAIRGDGAKAAPSYRFAVLRFSDKDLIVKDDDRLLWSSLDDESKRAEIKNDYTLIETPDRTYSCYRARLIDELP